VWTRDTAAPDPGAAVATTPSATLVLAPNANPWTFEGTNTWVLAAPGDRECAIVDPGPDDDGHVAAVLQVVGRRRVAGIWLTHRHHDHAQVADRLAALTDAPVRAAGHRDPSPLRDGDRLAAGRLRVDVLATPGHTPDSVSFAVPEDAALLTGDTVLGRGSPVVTPGGMTAMLATLRRLREHVRRPGSLVLPGHGPTLTDPAPEIGRRLAARERRIAQVAEALSAGVSGVEEIVDLLYPSLDPGVRKAAEISTAAAVEHLRRAEPATAVPGREERW
jgi:glyoxylase-like metal-dependent hydrolase (beta-lactamase superfamily II)